MIKGRFQTSMIADFWVKSCKRMIALSLLNVFKSFVTYNFFYCGPYFASLLCLKNIRNRTLLKVKIIYLEEKWWWVHFFPKGISSKWTYKRGWSLSWLTRMSQSSTLAITPRMDNKSFQQSMTYLVRTISSLPLVFNSPSLFCFWELVHWQQLQLVSSSCLRIVHHPGKISVFV